MRCFIWRVRRALAQVIVAGGCTRVIDAWVVSLEPAWQLAVLAGTLLTIAIAQVFLDDQGAVPGMLPLTSYGHRLRIHAASVPARSHAKCFKTDTHRRIRDLDREMAFETGKLSVRLLDVNRHGRSRNPRL
jgi:hypothetical protein